MVNIIKFGTKPIRGKSQPVFTVPVIMCVKCDSHADR